MKYWLRCSGVFATVSILCASSFAEPETVTLYYWGNDNFDQNDVLSSLDLIQAFEVLHDGSDGKPRIKVVMGQSGSIDRTADSQRLLCAIAGGDPPDVVWFDRFAIGEWALRKAFLPLQEFIEEDLRVRPKDPFTLRKEQFYPACWEEASYEGVLYGVPDSCDNRALFYNLDVLDKFSEELIAAGCVDPSDPGKVGPPRTWTQLREACRILTAEKPGGDLVRIGFLPHSPNFGNSWLYIYAWLNGGSFLSADGRTCTLNSPLVAEALSYVTGLYDIQGGTTKVLAFQTSGMTADLDPFMSGKIAMKIDGNWYVTTIANTRRDLRFGVALAPASEGNERVGWCGGFAFVIPKGCKHPREAWEFIRFMESQQAFKIKADAGKQIANAGGNVFIPSMSARRDINEWAMNEYVYSDPGIGAKYKDAVRVFAESMETSRFRPVTPVGQILWNEQVRAMENGIYKKYLAEDVRGNAQRALDESAALVQRELDRLYHPVEYPEFDFRPVVLGYLGLLLVGTAGLYVFFGRRSKAAGYFRKEFYAGYLFASPWFIGFAVFGGGPIFFSLVMSFSQYDVFNPPKFVGFANYVNLVTNDPLFYKSLWNTVYMGLSVPVGMVVGLGIAMLLSREVRGMGVYRTIFYLPAVMPAVAASILWLWIFNPQEGVLNSVLGQFGVPNIKWLQDEAWSKPALIIMIVWGAGGSMIIWLAGLKGIPQHLYEAAELDGAGPLLRFRHVTIPMLSPYILFNLIMGLIGTFQVFTQAYIMTRGGPLDSTLFYVYALFNNAFRYMKMGYASAMAWILFAIVLLLTVWQIRLSRRWVHYESSNE
ncbi:MAG: extracellular solute-binding protein [Candidatus Hydrogenedentales bacterium]